MIRDPTVVYDWGDIPQDLETGHFVLIREDCQIGYNVRIGSFCDIEDGVTIGDNVRIHSRCFLPRHTVIEDDVRIYPGVIFTNDKYMDGNREGAVVREGAEIGAGAIILPVEIGAYSTVGAGAVVTRDVPAGATVVGNPARVINETP